MAHRSTAGQSLLFTVIAGVVGGCSDSKGKDAGARPSEDAAVACADGASTELGLNEPSELGVSAADMLATCEGGHAGTMRWADGAESPASMDIAYLGGPATYTELEPTFPEYSCVAGVTRIGVAAALSTEDGRLAESWDVELRSSVGTTINVERQVLDFAGSLDPNTFVDDAAQYDAISFYFWMSVSGADGSATGSIEGRAEGHDGDPADPHGVAYRDTIRIGEFEMQPVSPSSE